MTTVSANNRVAPSTPSMPILTPSHSAQPTSLMPLAATSSFAPNVPTSSLKEGDTGAQVKLLQTDLVKLGYLTQAQMNTGPGTFGPHTKAALEAFQSHAKLTVTGRYGPAEKTALTKALTPPPTSSTVPAAGLKQGDTGAQVKLLQTDLVKLGFMTQAAMNTGPGTFGPHTKSALEAFQSHAKLPVTGRYGAADRSALSKALAPKPPPAPQPSNGKITTVAEANAFFITQWGPTAYNSSGHPYGYDDCAPTSSVMVASSLGLIPPPTPSKVETAIDHMRDLERGHNTTVSGPTSGKQVVRGLQASGAKTDWISHTTAGVDAALARGSRVVIMGDPWSAWGKGLHQSGKYLNSRDPGEHACAILGKAANGDYLVGDPLSSHGVIEVSAAQLRSFWSAGSPAALEVKK